MVTALSRMTRLSEAGEDYRHHFGTAGALQPQIVGATGAKAALRDDVETWDADGNVVEQEGPTKRASIPKDVRLPAFLIVLNCFCNTACYAIEFVTFAIFFKQVHNWNEAIWASLAQTAGDVMAAIAMQIIPAILPDNFDEDEAGPIISLLSLQCVPALHPHHHLGHPFPLQRWDDESVVALGDCGTSLHGQQLRVQFQVVNRHELVLLAWVTPMSS